MGDKSSELSCVAETVADGAGSSLKLRTSTKKIGSFEYDSVIEFDDLLRNLPRYSVSNAVSDTKKGEHSPANLSGQNVLRFGEIWTSESTGEQEIWS
jgi:hypothetical protein